MIDLFALLELYNTYSHNDLYYQMAQKILEQYNHLKLESLEGFANSIHVSPSSLNRFIKVLAYDNFTTYRAEHLKWEEYYVFDHTNIGGMTQDLNAFAHRMLAQAEEMLAGMDKLRVEELLRSMEEKEKTIFVGIPMPSDVWWLEVELVLTGRQTCAFLAPNDQIEAVEACGEGDLVVGLNIVRQDDMMLPRLLETARSRGAATACISHGPLPWLKETVDIPVRFRGNNTRSDQFALAVLLNYLSARLREGYLDRLS